MQMKRGLGLVLSAVILGFPTIAAAQDTKTVTGTITAIGASSITVKAADKEMTFNVDEKTDVIARGGSTATRKAQAAGKPGAGLSDLLKVSENVEVKYHEAGMHAASIRVVTSAPGPEGPRSQTAKGVVSAVSGTSLTVKGATEEWTFVIDDKTDLVGTGLGTKQRELEKQGKKGTFVDFIGKGDEVVVTYRDMAGAKHASGVRLIKKGMN
jgi:hypothetical protein